MDLISVLLPTYHGGKTLPQAIRSVLAQQDVSLELLVIDDAGEGEVKSLLERDFSKESRIRLIENEKNLGIQKSLNRGLQEAKGDYIARIDDDDYWTLSTKLRDQLAFLKKHPDHALVGTGAVVVDEEGKELFRYLNPEKDEEIRRIMLFKNPFIHSTILTKKEAMCEWHGYAETENTKHVEDHDLWLKIGSKHKIANLQEYAIHFTLRAGAISAKHKPIQMKRALALGWRWRKTYPGGWSALIFNVIRVIGVYILEWVPRSWRTQLFSAYKRA